MKTIVKEKKKIALILKDAGQQGLYRDAVSCYQRAEAEVFSSLREFKTKCSGKTFAGFVIDSGMLGRAGTRYKNLFNSIGRSIPVLFVENHLEKKVYRFCQYHFRPADLLARKRFFDFLDNECEKKVPCPCGRTAETKKVS